MAHRRSLAHLAARAPLDRSTELRAQAHMHRRRVRQSNKLRSKRHALAIGRTRSKTKVPQMAPHRRLPASSLASRRRRHKTARRAPLRPRPRLRSLLPRRRRLMAAHPNHRERYWHRTIVAHRHLQQCPRVRACAPHRPRPS